MGTTVSATGPPPAHVILANRTLAKGASFRMTNTSKDIKAEIINQLIESGKYNEIFVDLKQQLYETGWINELQLKLREILSKNESSDLKFAHVLNQLNLNDLYNNKLDKGVKKGVLQELDQFVLDSFDVS